MKKTSIFLGIAFLLQFFTSLISGMLPNGIVPGSSLPSVEPVTVNLINVANNAMLFRINMLGQTITAVGIIFLGAMLFIALRKQSEKAALIGFGFYILEAALLAASMIQTFLLLRTSQEYAAAQSAYLQTMGNLAFESMGFGMTLALVPFGLGAILFYYLLYKSGSIPRALSLWGLVTVCFVLLGTICAVFGYAAPIFIYLPYVPFEFVAGVWILVKGLKDTSTIAS